MICGVVSYELGRHPGDFLRLKEGSPEGCAGESLIASARISNKREIKRPGWRNSKLSSVMLSCTRFCGMCAGSSMDM